MNNSVIIDGVHKNISAIKCNIGGVWKNCASFYRYKRYSVKRVFRELELVASNIAADYDYGKVWLAVPNDEDVTLKEFYTTEDELAAAFYYNSNWSDGFQDRIQFEEVQSGSFVTPFSAVEGSGTNTEYSGYFFALDNYSDITDWKLTFEDKYALYILKTNGEYYYTTTGGTDGDETFTMVYGDVYKVVGGWGAGDYIDTVHATDMTSLPIEGELDGYYYVYDGILSWEQCSILNTYEPSGFGTSTTKYSTSLSFPVLMASQAQKNDNGEVDWGNTYSATSLSNIRSNYSKYPYTSLSSTLSVDSLYQISNASAFYMTVKSVTEWSVTSEEKGDYIGDISGVIGGYPADGIQEGYWYTLKEDALTPQSLIYYNIGGAWTPEQTPAIRYKWKKYKMLLVEDEDSTGTSTSNLFSSDSTSYFFYTTSPPSLNQDLQGYKFTEKTPCSTVASNTSAYTNIYGYSFGDENDEYKIENHYYLINSWSVNDSGIYKFIGYHYTTTMTNSGELIEEVYSLSSDAYPENGAQYDKTTHLYYWYVAEGSENA